jgi:hypothetical protein
MRRRTKPRQIFKLTHYPFLCSPVKRGVKGVRLIVSDTHVGLKQAISTVMTGTTWQRCRVLAGRRRELPSARIRSKLDTPRSK